MVYVHMQSQLDYDLVEHSKRMKTKFKEMRHICPLRHLRVNSE